MLGDYLGRSVIERVMLLGAEAGAEEHFRGEALRCNRKESNIGNCSVRYCVELSTDQNSEVMPWRW